MTKNNNEKIISALSYVLIGLIWYLIEQEKFKKNNNVKFHVKQGLNLLIISVVGNIIINLIFAILTFITLGLFGILWGIVSFIFSIFVLFLIIIGILNVINQEEKELPIIGEYANKYLNF